jgi:hypothetical protein
MESEQKIKLQQEIEELKNRIARMESLINEKERLFEEESKKLFLGIARPVKLKTLQRLLISFPRGKDISKLLGLNTLKKDLPKVVSPPIELLHEMPAAEVKKLLRQKKIRLNYDLQQNYKVDTITEILDTQEKVLKDVLIEQKIELKKKLRNKYIIGNNRKNPSL